MFIISIDTLRSDHLPAYGYAAGRTPALDRFRRDAVLFDRAFSHCPLTLPSHATIFTGQLPAQNGVRDNIGYTVASNAETLPLIAERHGYATGAAISSYVLRRSTGINRGFDFYDDSVEYETAQAATSAERDGDKTRAALERWLDNAGARPFALLHLYEPHAPYTPPAAFSNFAKPYDGEIAYADAIVGRLLDSLRRRGLYDSSLIILLSDHGEGLGDHGEDEHGVLLYREAIQVPLLIKRPHEAQPGSVRSNVVGLIDIAPTVLAQLHLDKPAAMSGVDVFAKPAPDRQIFSETYFPRLHLGWHELSSLTNDRLHLIAGRGRELFDYVADPAERHDVAATSRRQFAALTSALSSFPDTFRGPAAVDPEDQRKLAALGYIGSTAATSGDLPDPQTKIQVLRRLRQGIDALKAGDSERAISILTSVTREEPKIVDGWALLSRAYRSRGDKAGALRALRSAMQLFPHDASVALALSDALAEAGDYDAAAEHARLAIADNPALAHEQLTRIELRRGRLEDAEKDAVQAVAAAPERTASLRLLAEVRKRQERWPDALDLLDRVLAAALQRNAPVPPGVELDRGEVLLQLSRGPEAEQAFAAETQRYPQNVRAWASLAVVRAAKGDRPAAEATLDEMQRLNRTREAAAIAAEARAAIGETPRTGPGPR